MIMQPGVRRNSAELFPTVKPDATPEEVTAVVDDTDGTGGQIFSQAVRSANPIQLNQFYQSMVPIALSVDQVWSVQNSIQGSPRSSRGHQED